jgi:predicted AlkP superfamily pyrophosphatase or phosphodiesterase
MLRAAALAGLLAVLACGGPPVVATSTQPRLVVLLVVDGLPSWSFDAKLRSARRGFSRLVEGGVFYRQAAYPYAATYTGPGHAALVTGAPPSVTGIVANRWFDRAQTREVDAVEGLDDPMLDVIAPPPAVRSPGASPRLLLVDSIGDALMRASGGRARVVSLSMKRHAAVLLGGHRPSAAVWFDEGQAAFSTSRYYAAAAPAWVLDLAARRPAAPRIASYVWQPGDPAALAAATGLADDAPGELGIYGHGPAFPHRPASAEKPAQATQATPLADELLLEAVLAAIDGERLGKDDVPDLLCISFSAHDYVGHGWGQESWESLDEFIALDRVIGGLLDQLDARIGRGRWALLFASDHGATRVVEQSVAAGRDAHRLEPAALAALAAAAGRDAIGPGEWIADAREQLIYLSPAARSLDAPVRDRLLDAMVGALRSTPGVELAVRVDALPGCDRLAEREAMACRSIHPDRSGEIYFTPRADSVVMKKPWDTSTHGSASDDDRRVPIIVLEPGVRPARIDRPVSTLQVAPTLARLLRIAPPPHATAAPL